MVMSTAIMANFNGTDQTISFNVVTAIMTSANLAHICTHATFTTGPLELWFYTLHNNWSLATSGVLKLKKGTQYNIHWISMQSAVTVICYCTLVQSGFNWLGRYSLELKLQHSCLGYWVVVLRGVSYCAWCSKRYS